MQCKATEKQMAISSQIFPNIPILRSEVSSLNAFKALNISIITSTVNERVEAFCFPIVKYKQGFSWN